MSGRSCSRYPFTASQWQEMEHQALIFKYMASGIPIPPDLIIPIRRSFLIDSNAATPSLPFVPHTQLGWNCFQMGYGRKTEDPEPGRCRRTDGKKWRCSKEAYPDSKYCERHMHRGKNRSRKPVEISLATKPSHSSSSSSKQMSPHSANLSISAPETCHLFSPYASISETPPFQLDSANYSDRECRSQWVSSMAEAKQSNFFLSKEEEEERQRPLRHFFDECPERNKDQWMDMEAENSSYYKTQLSISFQK
ncbi:growth-regulating factor 1-like isoform X2 [Phalaenopsis equestris]|nr:growth-regulating factor 1-like isoform X2 [Phalaenopsis equestris]